MKYTVLVVNYNKEKEIEKCLNSIINQTYKNYELIIVDDGSTDKSRKIINKYKKYKNVKIYFKENTGVSDTRNFAISKVKTKFFLFVDSDDYISENLLEECEKYKDYDILSFNNYIAEKDKIKRNDEKGLVKKQNGKETLVNFIKNNSLFLVPWGYVYKTELFKKNNLKYPKGLVHEDVYLTTIAILKAKKIVVTNYYGYYYVQTENSIIRSRNQEKQMLRIKSILYNYDNLKIFFNNNIKDKELRDFYIGYYASGLLYEGMHMNGKAKRIYIKELKKLNIYEDIYIFSKLSYLKKVLLKTSVSLYYMIIPFNPIITFIYKKIRKVYYLVIKHEKI